MIFCSFQEGVSQDRFSFKNLQIGMGFNKSHYDISFPEVSNFRPNTDLKESLLIDLRLNFYIPKGLTFIPSFEFWSWGAFPTAKETFSQLSLDEYKLNLDFAYPYKLSARYTPYIGVGPGMQLVVVNALFTGTTQQSTSYRSIGSITEKRYRLGYNFFGGIEFTLFKGLSFNMEVRWEKTNILEQWKYLIGISMF